MKGIITGIQSLGTVDGPGVRTVVFSAGCPLRCAYCHNPETWERKGETADSLELASRILRYKPYIRNGGVTFSGGEPLMQGAFFISLAEELKKENLSVALDTSGNFSDEYTEALVDICDVILLDVKFLSEDEYRRYTGGSLSETLGFLEMLKEKRKRVWIRQVIIEGINDGEENARKLKNTLAPYKEVIERTELLPFRKLCLEKYDRMNIIFPFRNLEETRQITLDRMNAVLAEND